MGLRSTLLSGSLLSSLLFSKSIFFLTWPCTQAALQLVHRIRSATQMFKYNTSYIHILRRPTYEENGLSYFCDFMSVSAVGGGESYKHLFLNCIIWQNEY